MTKHALFVALFVLSVQAQAAVSPPSQNILAGASNKKPEYILNECQEFPRDMDESSAEHIVDPAGRLSSHYSEHYRREIDANAIRIALLEGPKHGEINSREANYKGMYAYYPNPNFLGADKVAFQAEFGGKRYKIVMKLIVTTTVLSNDPLCPKPRLIKMGGLVAQSGKDRLLTGPPHTTRHAGPHRAVHQESHTSLTYGRVRT